jgi:Ni,Fe-hydrogenase III small subunit
MYGFLIRCWRRRARVTVTLPRGLSPTGEAHIDGLNPRGSLQIRHIDAGSCNGCEMEIASIFSPHYDAEQYGIRLVASPRHADVALVTGPVTRNMLGPLRVTIEAMSVPSVVVALGDCARNCGVFAGAYGVEGSVTDVTDVRLEIPGCPPAPADIIAALRRLSQS